MRPARVMVKNRLAPFRAGADLIVRRSHTQALPASLAPANEGAWLHVRVMAGALRDGVERRPATLLALMLAAVVAFNALGQIWLNAWNRPFYDAIARRHLADFGKELLNFGLIVIFLLTLNVGQIWAQMRLKVTLREWVTRDVVHAWLEPGAAFRVARAGEVGVNPDQRIHEDARRLTELTVDLGVGLFMSSLLLVSFVGVLWRLSEGVNLALFGLDYAIPGYMVWCALIYSATGTWLSWLVGRPLIRLDAERYAREAHLRFSLSRASEHADDIALNVGEAVERRNIYGALTGVLDAMRAIVAATTRLTWVTASYGWVAIVAPLIVAAPGYFGGNLSFGDLMMVVGAFNQVQQSLRWFVDNMANVADWHATLIRVATFREALGESRTPPDPAERLIYAAHPMRALALENVELDVEDGRSRLCERHVEIQPGERVLIVGEPGSGKSAMFLALAALWPWGSGMLRLPPRGAMMFVTQDPYVPIGPLRAAVTYPSPPERFEPQAVRGALERAGLGHLLGALERVERWDRALSHDERRRLVMARLLLRQPQWIVLDAATDGLDEARRETLQSIMEKDLPRSTVIAFSRKARDDGFFTRILRLERMSDAPHPLRSAERAVLRALPNEHAS